MARGGQRTRLARVGVRATKTPGEPGVFNQPCAPSPARPCAAPPAQRRARSVRVARQFATSASRLPPSTSLTRSPSLTVGLDV